MALDNVPVFEGSEWNNIELYRLLSFKGGIVVDHVLLCCHNKIIDLSFGINLILYLFIVLKPQRHKKQKNTHRRTLSHIHLGISCYQSKNVKQRQTVSSESTNLYHNLPAFNHVSLPRCHDSNYYHMCLDQTRLEFKGDCLVDCMSIEQSTLGCEGTTRPVPLNGMLTSGAMLPVWLWPRDVPPLVQTGQQCQLVSDLSPLHPARVSTSIDTVDEDSKYGGPFIPTKAAHHAQKRFALSQTVAHAHYQLSLHLEKKKT